MASQDYGTVKVSLQANGSTNQQHKRIKTYTHKTGMQTLKDHQTHPYPSI